MKGAPHVFSAIWNFVVMLYTTWWMWLLGLAFAVPTQIFLAGTYRAVVLDEDYDPIYGILGSIILWPIFVIVNPYRVRLRIQALVEKERRRDKRQQAT